MKRSINLISAVSVDGSIGKNDKLLWKIPEDLEYYKSRTLNNIIIMGRTTFKTLPKVALRGRTHIIITNHIATFKSENYNDEVMFSPNPEHALSLACKLAERRECDVYVAGGQSIYEQLYDKCDYAFITWVDKKFENISDSFFPVKHFFSKFELISESDQHTSTGKSGLKYNFSVYRKQ